MRAICQNSDLPAGFRPAPSHLGFSQDLVPLRDARDGRQQAGGEQVLGDEFISPGGERRSRAVGGLHDQDPIPEAGEPLCRRLGLGTGNEVSDPNSVIGLSTDQGLHDMNAGDLRL